MKRRTWVMLTSLVLAGSCSSGPGERMNEPPRWGEVTLVEDLRIGRSVGPPEYMFALITDIAQHPDGSVFIVDSSRVSTFVRRYDRDGNFLNDVGRMGQGPGEFQRVAAIGITPDGDVALWDTRSRRLTIMSPDGSYLDSLNADSGLNSSQMLLIDASGNFYVRTWKEDPEDGAAQRLNGYLKYSPAGELIETIWLPRSGLMRGESWVTQTPGGLVYPFVRQTLAAVTTRGVLVSGANERYVLQYTRGGELQFRVERPWEPIELHAEEYAEWVARQAAISGQAARTSAPVNAPPTDRYPPIPETKPAFMSLSPGVDSTVWVRRYTAAHKRTDLTPRDPGDNRPRMTWWEYPTFDVFGLEGEFLGTVELPHEIAPVVFHSDYIWTVRSDEQGENVAVRFRVVKSGAS